MAESGGLQGAVYSSAYVPAGQVIQQGIAANERQNEKTLQVAQMLKEKADREGMQNLRTINDETNFDQYKTGEQHVDDFATQQLAAIKNKYIGLVRTMPPEQLEYQLQNELQPIFQWHIAAQNQLKQVNGAVTDFNKTYPNADLGKVQQIANSQFANNVMQKDDNGNLQMKPPQQIQNIDYGQQLQQPQVLGQVINDTSPFEKAIYGIPKEPVGGENYTNNRGEVVAHKWSGLKPTGGMGEYTYAPDGKPTGIKLTGTDIPAVTDPNTGQPMRIMNDDMYARLQQNPQVAGSMEKMWQDAKGNIEANYMQKTGKPLDPNTDNILKRAYLYQQANGLIGHDLKVEEIQKTPRININTGTSAANTSINDVYGDIKSASQDKNITPYGVTKISDLPPKAQEVVLDLANKLRPHGALESSLGQKDVMISTDKDGNISLWDNQGQKITDLTPKDINLAANKTAKQQQHILQQQAPAPSTTDKWSQYKRN